MTPAQRIGFRICVVFSVIAFSAFFLLHYRKNDLNQVLSTIKHSYGKPLSREAFIAHDLQSPIEGSFNKKAISELCAKTKWTPGLIFVCDPPQGGVGNVENVFFNCVRYAIEAGGAFIVPQIMRRAPDDLSNLHTLDIVPFDYLFDAAHFKSSLEGACPQMKVYDSVDDLREFPSAAEKRVLDTGKLSPELLHGFVMPDPSKWRAAFDEYLNSTTPNGISAAAPILVQIQALLQFPVTYDSPDFVHNLGRIFRFREDVRTLASTALFNLLGKLPEDKRTASRNGLYHYFGAHLRVASDATRAGWPGYDKQAEPYLEQAARQNLSTIYVATGAEEDMDRFRVDAAKKGYTAYSKTELLSGADLEALNQLNWDQHALIDLEILLKSTHFGGIEQSSFAWKVAARRHLLTKDLNYTRGSYGYNLGTWGLEDEFSIVYGVPGWPVFPLGMWP